MELQRQKGERDLRTGGDMAESVVSGMDTSFDTIVQIRCGLNEIERKLDKKIKGIEEWLSTEEVYSESHAQLDVDASSSRKSLKADADALFEDLLRIEMKLNRHTESEDVVLRLVSLRLGDRGKMDRILSELRMERDVLLEQVHLYLEQISTLKSKIEEQRCTAGAYERQLNAEYENQIRKLETEIEEVRTVTAQKDKQLKDVHEQLRQMNAILRSQESQSWKKKNEENLFINILKNDLQAIWNEKIKMEEELKRMKKICGYADVDFFAGFDDYPGSLLKRSKSMSDLTLVAGSSAKELGCEDDVDSSRGLLDWTDHSPRVSVSKGGSGGGGGARRRVDSDESVSLHNRSDASVETVRNASRQKILEELATVEKKLAAKNEEVKSKEPIEFYVAGRIACNARDEAKQVPD